MRNILFFFFLLGLNRHCKANYRNEQIDKIQGFYKTWRESHVREDRMDTVESSSSITDAT